MTELVSIIVPAYNRADFILETLRSIRTQEYQNIETIVVDDGSTDGTSAVVEEWIRRHRLKNMRLLTFSDNRGKPEAVNQALEETRGDFVVILDSDDLLLPQSVNVEREFLRNHSDVGLVFAGAYLIRDTQRTTLQMQGFSHISESDDMIQHTGDLLLRVNPIIASTVMMRRRVIDAAGPIAHHLRYTHDWEYWIRVSKISKIGFINQPLLYYRAHERGSSRQRFSTFREIVEILFSHLREYPRWKILSALSKQTRYNTGLSFSEGNFEDSLRICAFGMKSMISAFFKADTG